MNKPANTPASFFRFLALTYGITWLFWISAALLQQNVTSFPTILLHTLGGFGPSIAGVWMIYRTTDPAGRRDFWGRVFDFRRLGLGWTLFILAIFPLITYASIRLSYMAGGPEHSFAAIQQIAAQPLTLVTLLLYGLIAGPIAEELGWRGFALDALLTRWNVLTASIILGVFWWAWHIPLFFILGTTQHNLGLATLEFWQFAMIPLPLSAIMTWGYLRTGRSILSAILMHLSFNFSANLFFPLSPQAVVIHLALMTAIAAAALYSLRRDALVQPTV